jgi:hypothetical protein
MSNFHETFWITDQNIHLFDFSIYGTEEFDVLSEVKRRNKNKYFKDVDFNKNNVDISHLIYEKKDKVLLRECQNIDKIIFPDRLYKLEIIDSEIKSLINTKYIDFLHFENYTLFQLEQILNNLQNIEINILKFSKCHLPNFNIFKKLKIKKILLDRDSDIVSIDGIEELEIDFYFDIYLYQYDWKLPVKPNFYFGSYIYNKEEEKYVFNFNNIRNEYDEDEENNKKCKNYKAINELVIIEHDLTNLNKLNKFVVDINNHKGNINFQNIDFQKYPLDFQNIRSVEFKNCINLQFIRNFKKLKGICFKGMCKGKLSHKIKINGVKLKNMSADEVESIVPFLEKMELKSFNLCGCRVRDLKLISNIDTQYAELCLLNKVDSYKNLNTIKYRINFEDLLSFKYRLEMNDKQFKKLPKNVSFIYTYCY